jgi:transcription-repair coupling factor (superfamily II helicase)
MNNEWPLRFDQIVSSKTARKAFCLNIVGTTSPTVMAMILDQFKSNNTNGLPHVVLTDSLQTSYALEQGLQFFNPSCRVFVMPEIEVSPYSGLFPKPSFTAEKLKFLFGCYQSLPTDVFIVSQKAAMQKCMPYKIFGKGIFKIKKDFDFPDKIHEFFESLGYQNSPYVEDMGQYAVRGGIVDVFSPAHDFPVRIELFGSTVETLKSFSVETHISTKAIENYFIIPAQEVLFSEINIEKSLSNLSEKISSAGSMNADTQEWIRSLSRERRFPGIEYLLNDLYGKSDKMWDYFSSSACVWYLDLISIEKSHEDFIQEIKTDAAASSATTKFIKPTDYLDLEFQQQFPPDSVRFNFSGISVGTDVDNEISYSSASIRELSALTAELRPGSSEWCSHLSKKISEWQEQGNRIVIALRTQNQAQRLKLFLQATDIAVVATDTLDQVFADTDIKKSKVFVFQRPLPDSVRIKEEKLVFLRDEDLFGNKTHLRRSNDSAQFQKEASRLSFGELKVGDLIVHKNHGIGQYDGLKVMDINGAETEFLQLSYRDKDKLYLPVYKVGQLQRYSSGSDNTTLDKLGNSSWEKTKIKVRSHLRDIAADLLKLYAERSQHSRDSLIDPKQDFFSFESEFAYDETEDQLRAVADISKDFLGKKPMDRLICGDVGFGKTEVAMRATFWSVYNKKQVGILAPTTVLTFQHFETFKNRFKNWPVKIKVLNRFVTSAEVKKTVAEIKSGDVDIVVGTHRLLSKDVEFKNLGLLIVDEEQRFGVAHKEKIRKLKSSVDTLAMSATPIPRTLNLSLVGIRDLSLINTAPVDRLPTRTLICKFEKQTIRKAILSEIARGGQIYFIHNRIQSIYSLADELKDLVPEARIKIGHGQQDEHELEKTMMAFFNHEIDVLLSTAIVESGVDNPRANTMFIDQAHTFGLSQLYQLRGRVGRSKQRAYCYLLIPKDKPLDKDSQERLKIIQENTDLGSGIRIAQYDLELRGAGNILGEEQSGHINAVGYELYMDLLNESLQDAKGVPNADRDLDPEINLRIS